MKKLLSGPVAKKGFKVTSAVDAATLSRLVFADGRTGRVSQNAEGYIRSVNGLIISFR